MHTGFLVSVLLALATLTSSQDLTVTFLSAFLPNGRSSLSAVYDGKDSVYLFGGDNQYTTTDAILKYDILNDSIEEVAKFPKPVREGSAILGNDGNFYHFGAAGHSEIWKFSPLDNSVEKVGDVPYTDLVRGATSVVDWIGDNVYIFGYPKVLKFTISSKTISPVNDHTNDPMACSAMINGRAYIFGGDHYNASTGEYKSREIWRYTPGGNTMELMQSRLLAELDRVNAVWDGTNVYIVGGYGENKVMMFNPATEAIHYPNVTGFDIGFFAPASVFVAKQSRMYIFGGGSQYGPMNSIRYISV